MIEPEIPNSIASSFGFRIRNMERKIWSISESKCQDIIRHMVKRGMPYGELEVESENNNTSYRFDFFPKGKGTKPVISYRIYYNGESLVLSVGMDDLPKKEKEWGGEEDDEEIRRLNLFIGAINDSIGKTLGFKKPTLMKRVGEEEPKKEEPNPYGYADPDEQKELEAMMKSMSLGKKEGGRKTRRRKNKRKSRKTTVSK